jgi:flagellar biosynthesis protein FlhF
MQVKKFEAPTIQEALDTIKRELGPDAIILQTKKYKRGFGLMSRASIEVTAAVSERSLQKKQYVEKRMPETVREAVKKMPAEKQSEFFNKSTPKASPQKRPATNVAMGNGAVTGAYQSNAGSTKLTTTHSKKNSTDAYVPSMRSAQSQSQSQSQAQAQAPLPAQLPATQQSLSYGSSNAGATSGESATQPKVTSRRYAEIDDLEMGDELKHLKRMIEELKSAQDAAYGQSSGAQAMFSGAGSVTATPALQNAFEQLVISGLDRRYALALVKTAAFELGSERSENPDEVMDQLATEVMKNTKVTSPLAGVTQKGPETERRTAPMIIALVGPTGVGKTTTVAKLASEAILKHNVRVGLINLDSYKIAAFDQLGTYAKILNVPFRSVAKADELRDAVRDFQSLDLILVDTTGRSQRDPESLREMQELVATVPNMVTQLVLSVTTRDTELYDMANRFSIFSPQGIIVSKLDESTSHGAIYNIAMRTQLPLLCFTTGQRVPEDIEEATRERVAALLLNL